jgi:hypothetical protein
MSKPAGCVLAFCIAMTCVMSAAPDFEALGRDTVGELTAGAFKSVTAVRMQDVPADMSVRKSSPTSLTGSPDMETGSEE